MAEQYDMLEDIMTTQKLAQEFRGFKFPMEGPDAAQYIKTQTLHCIDELCEMLHEIKGYKEWKKYDFSDAEDNRSKRILAKEELVDAFHFFLNIAIALNISPADLYRAYMAKSHINYSRLTNTAEYKKDTED